MPVYKKAMAQPRGRICAAASLLSAVVTYENIDLNRGSFNDVSNRVRASRGNIQWGRTAVMLIFGQSNGANSREIPYAPRNRIFNLNVFDGHCYVARDPLL